MDRATEVEIRHAAAQFLADASEQGIRSVSTRERDAFRFRGEQVYLWGQQGIFKPRQLDAPISIRTTFVGGGEAPYEDQVDDLGYLHYSYRSEPNGRHENEGLRRAMREALPLIYLAGVDRGRYAVSGAMVLEDHPADRQFLVALTPIEAFSIGLGVELGTPEARRHQMALTKIRVGQAAFRERVMVAYRTQCAVCRLKRGELLDAAHIIPHRAEGALSVSNGLSLCKIHHAAFDANLMGIRPDYVAEVRSDLLDEIDGPMLQHGIKDLHGITIVLPRQPSERPSTVALEQRYEAFRAAV